MPDIVAIKTALISVSDKTDIVSLARGLEAAGVRIISTGGTAKLLKKEGIDTTPVADITGMAEMMDGRIKTLHPAIHGGILARRDNDAHIKDMKAHGIEAIDLVVVNLYPFAQTLAKKNASDAELVENIDIGGPAMIRAAAKNHDFTIVLTDAEDYAPTLDAITKDGGVSLAMRRSLAGKAFAHTAEYDAMVANWMNKDKDKDKDTLPAAINISGKRVTMLRYGENPHQQAALYRIAGQASTSIGVLEAEQVQGKPLSYNNINDTDAALGLIAEFDAPSVAIIKHANPCGVASHKDLGTAWNRALASDPISAFGGIVAINKPLDEAIARRITDIFTEVIIAPDADEAARAIIAAKPNLRLLLTGEMPLPAQVKQEGLMIKSITGGFLAQSPDTAMVLAPDLECVTKHKPAEDEIKDMLFAMKVAKHAKSNAVVYARDEASIAIGTGQTSRVDSSMSAIRRAQSIAAKENIKEPLAGSVMASEAFLPFADSIEIAVGVGCKSIIQPGGSIRDPEVITAADEAGIAMVFTGIRHFRH